MSLNLIWIGTDPSDATLATQSRWQAAYGQEVKLWVESDLVNLPDGPWRNPNYHPAQRADLLRVSLVQWFGGWYADVDCEPGTEPLPHPNHALLSREDTRQFINAFFYAPKESAFMKHWSEELLLSLQEQHRTSIAEATGPGALTRALHTYSMKVGIDQIQEEVKYFEWNGFRHWPRSVLGTHDADKLPSARFASHIAEASWITGLDDSQAKSSRWPLWAWRLRHSQVADASEMLRVALQNPDLALKSIRSKPLRKALQHSSLDSIGNSTIDAIQPLEVQNLSELTSATRRDGFVVVNPMSPEIAQAVRRAGWEKISNNPQLWIRPRPTLIINKDRVMSTREQ